MIDWLLVIVLFICYTASDDSRAVMLMRSLIFTFLSLVHVYSFMNATRDMHITSPSVCPCVVRLTW